MALDIEASKEHATMGNKPAHSEEAEAPPVVGLNSEEIVNGYWKSPRFLGSCAAIVFQANSLFFGYAIPVGSSLFGASDHQKKSIPTTMGLIFNSA
jgi:hypothetical protein